MKQQESVKKNNERRRIDYAKHFLLPGVKSVRITKIENNVDFSSFPFVPYSDVGTDNCANTSFSSDSAKLKLSKCYNHVNLNMKSGRSQEFAS